MMLACWNPGYNCSASVATFRRTSGTVRGRWGFMMGTCGWDRPRAEKCPSGEPYVAPSSPVKVNTKPAGGNG